MVSACNCTQDFMHALNIFSVSFWIHIILLNLQNLQLTAKIVWFTSLLAVWQIQGVQFGTKNVKN